MRFNSTRSLAVIALAVMGVTTAARAVPLFALSTENSNNLFTLDSTAPDTIISGTTISGLQLNEQIVSIDVRPSTGQLYGVGSSSRLYTINPITGVATSVSGGTFSPLLNGTNFDADFNPVPDLLRVVSDADQNLRINPGTGMVTNVDGSISFASLPGNNPNVGGIAYSNNVAGATSTKLYAIDTGKDTLFFMDPNSGVLTTIGALGLDATSILGFDIYTQGGTDFALAVLQIKGTATSNLYSINLGNGTPTLIGEIGGGFVVRDITAAVPEPATLGLAGMAAIGLIARRRRA